MRHGNKVNKLGRTASHRKSMLSNMAVSLIKHKSITTTLAKAKALRVYVEPLLTKAKKDDTNNRRVVFSYLQDKEAIKEVFGVVAEKISTRPGGYTRILKVGVRAGDNTEMAVIELIDFNEFYQPKEKKTKAKSTRRGRSGTKTAKTVEPVAKVEEIVSPEVNENTEETLSDALVIESTEVNLPEESNSTETAEKDEEKV